MQFITIFCPRNLLQPIAVPDVVSITCPINIVQTNNTYIGGAKQLLSPRCQSMSNPSGHRTRLPSGVRHVGTHVVLFVWSTKFIQVTKFTEICVDLIPNGFFSRVHCADASAKHASMLLQTVMPNSTCMWGCLLLASSDSGWADVGIWSIAWVRYSCNLYIN